MAFIHTVSPATARDDVAQMYRQQEAGWGFVPNYARVFSHRPAVLARWAALLAEIKRPLDRRRFELVTFAAAHALGNSACTLAHGRVMREFFADEQIVALTQGREDGVLSEADAALVRFARRVALDASTIDATEVQALAAQGLGDAEIFDAAAAVALRCFFAKLLDALGVQPDAVFTELPEPLREALTVGRAIDAGPCVTMPREAAGAGGKA